MSALSLPLPGAARALRLEFKRNAVPWLLPLLAAVFYFNTMRTADGFPPVWTLRASVIGNHMLFEFGAFAGGMAAWAASREGRRKTADLVSTTPRAAWGRLSITLAGTLCWLLLAFLAGVTLVYVTTALKATAGGPPLWPVCTGVAGVTVVSVIGFACGILFPSRFTAPLVAVGTLLLYQAGLHAALSLEPGDGTYALLSPAGALPNNDVGVYYRVAPDQSVVQIMLMAGIAVTLFGLLGLAPDLRRLASARAPGSLRAALARREAWSVRAVAAALIVAGAATGTTAVVLAGTARPDPVGGWAIPALHSAAGDQSLPPAQICTTGFPVCVNRAFSFYLAEVSAAVKPVAAEVAGLPGAPVRATEVAGLRDGEPVMSGISGQPPVFRYTAEHVGTMFGEFFGIPGPAADWRAAFQVGLLDAFLASESGAPASTLPLGAAQQAVENALLAAVGTTPAEAFVPAPPAIAAASRRFLALPASARHAWLTAHLAALRRGQIALGQIP